MRKRGDVYSLRETERNGERQSEEQPDVKRLEIGRENQGSNQHTEYSREAKQRQRLQLVKKERKEGACAVRHPCRGFRIYRSTRTVRLIAVMAVRTCEQLLLTTTIE